MAFLSNMDRVFGVAGHRFHLPHRTQSVRDPLMVNRPGDESDVLGITDKVTIVLDGK